MGFAKNKFAAVAMVAICSIQGKVFAADYSQVASTFYKIHPLVGMAFCEHYSSKINTLEANSINQQLNHQMPQIWEAFKPMFMAQLQVRTLSEMKKMVVQNFETGFKKELSGQDFSEILKNNPGAANLLMADCMRNILGK